MNTVKTDVGFDDQVSEARDADVSPLGIEELGLVGGGECVLNSH